MLLPLTATLPWELDPNLPWHVFTSPLEKWAVQPTFAIGEFVFIALAVLALWHARQRGRAHVLAWVAALVAGTCNDAIFMALPLVDNFWHAQASVMLTPRLPLYIPCVYVCFMYLPTVAVWRLRMPRLAGAALAGLVAIAFYAAYDITGAKFLWWTWHDTDLPIATRILGAPAASSLWVITFAATFYWLLSWSVDRDPEVSTASFAKGVALVGGLTTVLMVLQMTLLQQLDGGSPGPWALGAAVVVYAAVSGRGLVSERPESGGPRERALLAGLSVYFLMWIVLAIGFHPETHRSASLHQTYGPCHVEATDITGATRYEFLCAEDFDEDFSFECVDGLPDHGEGWYTVCGRPHSNRTAWIGGVTALSLVGAAAFWLLLGS